MLRICPICGKEFETGLTYQKYCSKQCRGKGLYKNKKARQTGLVLKEKELEFKRPLTSAMIRFFTKIAQYIESKGVKKC